MEETFNNKRTLGYSIFWKKSWFILSALMNAISLINIGADLKVVIIKWAEFFIVSFDFIRRMASILLSPFSLILSIFDVDIPNTIKDIFAVSFLFVSVYTRSAKERDLVFNKNLYSKQKSPQIRASVYTFASFLAGFLIGCLIASISWIGYLIFDKYFYYFISFCIVFLFLLFIFWRHQKEDYAFLIKQFKAYMLTVLLFVALICLVNYFWITFNRN